MSAQTVQRVTLVMAFCLFGPALVYADDSKAMDIVYRQHWKPPDTPSTYGKGQVIALYPSVGEPASAIQLTIQLADSGYTNEWNNGGNSEWDLVTSMDGINWIAEQVRIGPATFTDHGGSGAMTVNLSLALAKTGGQEKVKQFELYGTCWGMKVSPKTAKGAHFVIYGKVTWQTDNPGIVQKCTVEFLGTDQARGLLSQSYFPQRKVDYDRPLPAVTAYTVNRPTVRLMACPCEVRCCPRQLNCMRKRVLCCR